MNQNINLIPFQSGTSEEKPAAAAEEAAAGAAGARGRAPPHSPPPPRPRSCGRPARGPGAGAGDGGLEAGGHPQHGQGRGQRPVTAAGLIVWCLLVEEELCCQLTHVTVTKCET